MSLGVRGRSRAGRIRASIADALQGYRLLRATKYGLGPLIVLTVVDFVQEFDNAIFGLVLPDIRREFGVSLTLILTVTSVVGFLILLSGPVVGFIADRVRRTAMVGLSAVASGVFSVLTGTAGGLYVMSAIRGVDEFGERVGDVPARALLADYYPIEARGKAYSFKEIALRVAAIAAPPTAGFIAVRYGWRAPFVLAGLPLILTGVYALIRLREPVRGYWERKRLGAEEVVAQQPEPPVSWGESLRTILAVRTIKRIFIAIPLVVGAGLGFNTLLVFLVRERFHVDPFQLGLIRSPAAAAGLVGVFIGGAMVDMLVRRRPGRVLGIQGAIGMTAAGLYSLIAVAPSLAIVVGVSIALAFVGGFLAPASFAALTLVMPPRVRAQAVGLLGLVAAPAIFLTPVAASLADQYGIQAGMLLFTPVYFVAGGLLASAGGFFELDMRAAIASATAAHEYRKAKEEGQVRMLIVKDVDVHYDSVQVLFNVDLVVDDGEIVALLGTNGAGKSTLLRAVSGINQASNGAVLFDGRDITHLPPHEIAALGIVLMPGGRGVFPGLTVRENLDLALGSVGDAAERAQREQQVYDYFPVIEGKLDDLAGLLSGGEQQMVSLAQAFITRPRLLMIDELSLGLAPAVVQQLLEIVRAIHRQGTTIVLVEQSVNVALTIAERAVFMEKGEVKFDGATKDLLARPDIMRAVYLKRSGALTEGPRRRVRERAGAPERRAVLAVENLTKRFGGVTAVDDVSFSLREGEVLGFVGPNGAGKTTLFDLISGFIDPEEGRVFLEGADITKLGPDARARQGMIRRFQEGRLFSSLTVFEAICVALEKRHDVRNIFLAAAQIPSVRRAEERVKNRADTLIELLELGDFRDKFVSELSTGLRRVVDIACVLGAEPKVLLLDEPSAGIAQAEAENLAPLLRRVRFETGCSLLIIEHDMALISAVSDELVAMVQGSIVTRGRPDDVLNHPEVVQAYLGTDEAALRRSGVLKV